MINKLLLIGVVLTLASGCAGNKPEVQPRTVIEYREVLIAIPSIPTPPNTDCPQTDLETINPFSVLNNAQLAKAYRITVFQLRDCADLRQRVLDKYRDLATQDAEAITTPKVKGPLSAAFPTDELRTRKQTREIGDAFSEFEVEFDKLKDKDYKAE